MKEGTHNRLHSSSHLSMVLLELVLETRCMGCYCSKAGLFPKNSYYALKFSCEVGTKSKSKSVYLESYLPK